MIDIKTKHSSYCTGSSLSLIPTLQRNLLSHNIGLPRHSLVQLIFKPYKLWQISNKWAFQGLILRPRTLQSIEIQTWFKLFSCRQVLEPVIKSFLTNICRATLGFPPIHSLFVSVCWFSFCGDDREVYRVLTTIKRMSFSVVRWNAFIKDLIQSVSRTTIQNLRSVSCFKN